MNLNEKLENINKMLLTIIYIIQVFIFMCMLWGLISNRTEIYNYISEKKQKIDKLNQIRKNSGITVYSVVKLCTTSVYVIMKTKLIMTIHHYMNGLNIIQRDRDLFEVGIFLNGKFVRMLIRIKRGPGIILQAINDKYQDITDELSSYYDYDLCMITPKEVGSKSVDIITSNGEDIKYVDRDKIL